MIYRIYHIWYLFSWQINSFISWCRWKLKLSKNMRPLGLFYVWQCFNLITFLNILSFSQESAFVSNYFSTICDPIFRATPPRRGLFVINLKEFLRKLNWLCFQNSSELELDLNVKVFGPGIFKCQGQVFLNRHGKKYLRKYLFIQKLLCWLPMHKHTLHWLQIYNLFKPSMQLICS